LGLSIKIDELTKSISTDGTLRYASPQQRNGKRYSTAADIWGLGCVAMEIITLIEHVDFYNELKQDSEWMRKKLAPFEQIYDEKLIQFVHRTLVIDQKDRATATELLTLLEEDEDNIISDPEVAESEGFLDEEEQQQADASNAVSQRNSKILHVGSFDSFVSEIETDMKKMQENAIPQQTSDTPVETKESPFPVKTGFESKLHVLLQKRNYLHLMY
jgi:serine/threonine protein kinase